MRVNGDSLLDGVTSSGHSDRGAVRRINEDSFVIAPPVFLVADGMGGHAHGDRASQAVASVFAAAFPASVPTEPADVLAAIHLANERVLALGDGDLALSGTTLVGLALVQVGPESGCHWMAFNVGDSRIYTWDGRALVQLSVDHSAVQELVDAGLITRREADVHPERNIVTRALGADALVDPDVWLLPAVDHQTFLLCSDGLTKELDDDEIARVIAFHDSEAARHDTEHPLSLPERLVNAAIAAGGSDNVTVVIVDADLAPRAHIDDDTSERGGMPRFLEETRPRG